MDQTITPFDLRPSAAVFYFPRQDLPTGPGGLLTVREGEQLQFKATVLHVHNARLVDLLVVDHAGEERVIRFVPFLYDGDPVPGSPCGHCQQFVARVPKDEARQHAIMEGSARPSPTHGPDGHPLPAEQDGALRAWDAAHGRVQP